MNHSHHLKRLFFSGIRWNLVGSIIYEATKFAHQLILLNVIGLHTYGLVGSTFSFMYLTLHLCDMESGKAVLPFIKQVNASRKSFATFMRIYIPVNLLLLFTGSCIALYAYAHLLFSATLLPAGIIIGTIISEGLRIFLRHLLHTNFWNKPTVLIDLSMTMLYFSAVWIPYLLFNQPPTIHGLFIPYLVSSLGAVLLMGGVTYTHYQTLPLNHNGPSMTTAFFKKLFIVRCQYAITHLSKHFFTGNFLTPLFAIKFGLGYAGLLKFSSYIADGIKALINVSIGFSGGALLARLKGRTHAIKRRAFTALWKTFTRITYPLIILLTINFSKLFMLWQASRSLHNAQIITQLPTLTESAFIISLVLLFISLTENFFLVYEEFYLIEEEVWRLMITKGLEYTLFFGLVLMPTTTNPASILISAVAARITSFYLLAHYAYNRWHIQPDLRAPAWYLAGWVALAALCSYLLG